MKRNAITLVISLIMAVLLIACGGGGDEGPPPNYNAILSGVYEMNQIKATNASDAVAVWKADLDFDGNGTYEVLGSGGTTFSYDVAADRTITVAGIAQGIQGIVSDDGNFAIFALTDASGTELSLTMIVKKSSGTAPPVKDDYLINQVGVTDRGFGYTDADAYTSRVNVFPSTPPAATTRDIEILAHSDVVPIGITGTVTFAVSTDGTISGDNGTATDNGIVTPDGGLFVVADADAGGDGDNEIILGLGIEKATAAGPSVVDGEYLICQIGKNSGGIYTSVVKVTADGAGAGAWEILEHSQPAAVGASGTHTYDVSADGTMFADNTIGVDYGVVSGDGNIFALTDADVADTDGEIMFSIGIKKP